MMNQLLLQNYQMNNYSKITPRDTVTESEIYEDMSEAFLCFKNKVKNIISQSLHNADIKDDNRTHDELASESIRQLSQKYRTTEITRPEFQIIIERFIVRMKESIRHVATIAAKLKVDLMISIRKLELNIFKMCQSRCFHGAICFILDYIESFSLQNLTNQTVQTVRPHNKSVTTTVVVKNAPERLINNRSAENLKHKKQTEAEQFIRNAQKYACIDVDIEFLRGRYFDLKQHNQQFVQDAYARNSYIKRMMTSFEKEYQLARQRNMAAKSKLKSESQQKMKPYYLKSSIEQPIQLTDQKDSFFRTAKENNYFSHSTENKRTERIPTKSTHQMRTTTETFRSIYQEKLKERKTNAIKMKNVAVIICDDQSTLYAKNVNTRRMQFFKKSQEQTRLRYKYYNYVRKDVPVASNTAMKYKSINPETMFSTLTYK